MAQAALGVRDPARGQGGLALSRLGVDELKDKAEAAAASEGRPRRRCGARNAERQLAARKDANNKLAEQARRATELKKEYKAATKGVERKEAAEGAREAERDVAELSRRLQEQRKGLDAAARSGRGAVPRSTASLSGATWTSWQAPPKRWRRSRRPRGRPAPTPPPRTAPPPPQGRSTRTRAGDAAASGATTGATVPRASSIATCSCFAPCRPRRHARGGARAGWPDWHAPRSSPSTSQYGFALEACGGTRSARSWSDTTTTSRRCRRLHARPSHLKILVMPSEGRFTPAPPPRERPVDSRGEVASRRSRRCSRLATTPSSTRCHAGARVVPAAQIVRRVSRSSSAPTPPTRAPTRPTAPRTLSVGAPTSEPALTKPSAAHASLLCGGGGDARRCRSRLPARSRRRAPRWPPPPPRSRPRRRTRRRSGRQRGPRQGARRCRASSASSTGCRPTWRRRATSARRRRRRRAGGDARGARSRQGARGALQGERGEAKGDWPAAGRGGGGQGAAAVAQDEEAT